MTPFSIDVPQKTIDAIRARVSGYEWHEMPRGAGLDGTWAYGANLEFIKALCGYWVECSAHRATDYDDRINVRSYAALSIVM